ncbi:MULTISPECIES: hypothetical protein [Bacillus cereus group]|uniref:Uncharacterized protein n=1 Tax=Bacillus cereus TaxID=1396 RepID=A0A9X6VS51_BACCE|nr:MULTISPECIES: hypothetical protein [Bacillus cereus group]PEK04753.1 hypothetical protein CN690_00180 [Bacillus wiedmannii]PFF41476.1 hypothetical protein CN357_31650 [Bacillus cereus]PFO41246.1 hypothetical protein COJ82_04590 [Bacillus cereus]PGT26774.1 hypothetical protein COC99_11625 [Bacillus cereus]
MARVYFAKFNVNENIYKVYEDKGLLNELLNKMYREINNKVKLTDKNGTYKFINLDKNLDTLVVNGRIVVYAPGIHATFDEDEDKVVEEKDDKKAMYITFSFDIQREIIGFVPKFNFGRKQFLERFKNLIEACCDIGEVELFLENDSDLLDEKLKVLAHTKEIDVHLIPPNGDKKQFKELFGLDSEELRKTEGTRFTFKIAGTAKKGIDISSKYIRRFITGVQLGYGKLKLIGKNRTGEDVTINSEEDTPFTRPILENNKDSIPAIQEKTRAGGVQLLAAKARVRTIGSGEETKQSQ